MDAGTAPREHVNTGFGQSLLHASSRWRRVVDAKLRPLGLSQATWRLLFAIARAGDGRLQKDLARILGIEGASLVRLLDSLETAGLIERRVSTEDRRGKTAHLTKAGEATVREIQEIINGVGIELLDGLSARQLEASMAILETIKDNAGKLLERGDDERNDAA